MFKITIENIPDEFGLVGHFGIVGTLDEALCEAITEYQETGKDVIREGEGIHLGYWGIRIRVEKTDE